MNFRRILKIAIIDDINIFWRMKSCDSILLLTMKHYGRVPILDHAEGNHLPEMWSDDILITAGHLFIRVLPNVVQFDATHFRDNILYDVNYIGSCILIFQDEMLHAASMVMSVKKTDQRSSPSIFDGSHRLLSSAVNSTTTVIAL
jgi:hypothetical protein